jgi:DNA-binding SARP family transcriptional activator/Flp pilus assembly protein TadD
VVTLQVLGGLVLSGADGPLTGPVTQRKRLALAALLAAAPSQRLPRERLMGYLWPEIPPHAARHQLSSALYEIRRAIGAESVTLSGHALQLNPLVVRVDLLDFREALRSDDLAGAVASYRGPFLDGFFLPRSPEFDQWVDLERTRVAEEYGHAVEGLAERAELRGDFAEAVAWWRNRAAQDPVNARVAARLMIALEAVGDRGGALAHAARFEALLRTEFEAEVDPEVGALAERIRTAPREPYASVARVLPPQAGGGGVQGGGGQGGEVQGGGVRDPAIVEAHPPALRRAQPARRAPWKSRRWVAMAATLGALAFGLSGGPDGEGSWWRNGPDADQGQLGGGGANLGPALGLPELNASEGRRITALELTRRGRDPLIMRTEASAWEGLHFLSRAVALDPSLASAFATLSLLYLRLSNRDAPTFRRWEGLVLAEGAARRALELDGDLPEAHAALAIVQMARLDPTAAERHLLRALELAPDFARAREWQVGLHVLLARPEAALESALRAHALDPLSPTANAELARALLVNGRCSEALDRLTALAGLDPPLLRVAPLAAECHLMLGNHEEARRWAGHLVEERGPVAKGLLAHVLARTGEGERAVEVLEELSRGWEEGEFGAFPVAVAHAGFDGFGDAFRWLERALDDGSLRLDPGSPFLMQPAFAGLRLDPRFALLRDRMGIPPPDALR